VPASPPRAAPTLKTLLGLAWPMVVSRASQVVIGACDAAMIAGLGEGPLAATTTGAMNSFTLLIFPMGAAFIVSSFSSQLFGRGDATGARRYGFYGLGLAIATQLLAFFAIAAIGPVLGLFPYTPEVRQLMTDYMRIRLLSSGAAIGIEALGNYYGGLGRTRLPMIANVAAMTLNVVGNWILIFGNLGAPALGVRGTAMSSAIATTIAFVGLLAVFLFEGRKQKHASSGTSGAGRIVPELHLSEFMRMLRFGIPSGFNWFFEFFAFILFINIVVANLGTATLAAMMSVMQINGLSFMPAFGLASAGAILVGQAIGADAKHEVPRILRLTFSAAGTWQGFVGLIYLALPAVLIAGFAPPGPAGDAVRAVGVRILMLSAAWQLFDAAATTLAEGLRATGDTAFTMWARMGIAWGIFAPGAYVTVNVFGGGDVGAVLWLVAYLGLLAATLFLRFRSGAWRKIQLTEPPPLV
jgi:MATE family multidrug resistance protein